MKPETKKVRLDKFLWAIRVFKTRSLASEACTSGRVKLNNECTLKASHVVKTGETLHVRIDSEHTRIIEIKNIIDQRQSYSSIKENFIEHSNPPKRKEILPSVFVLPQGKRERGSGRPTKKDRRELKNKGLFD